MKPLSEVIRNHGFSYHFYADDTLIYLAFQLNGNWATCGLETCVSDIKLWMQSNMLHINQSKTELVYFHSKRKNLAVTDMSMKLDQCEIQPNSTVKNLGVFLDTHLSMETQITHMCRTAYYHLYNISLIRRYLTKEVTHMLVHNLVLSRMDCANCLLFHVADKYIRKLQRVQNLAARIILNIPTFDHVSPALQSLHWLPIKARIEYRILLMVYKIIYGLAPEYLSDLVTIYTPKRSLRYINETKLVVPKSKTVM